MCRIKSFLKKTSFEKGDEVGIATFWHLLGEENQLMKQMQLKIALKWELEADGVKVMFGAEKQCRVSCGSAEDTRWWIISTSMEKQRVSGLSYKETEIQETYKETAHSSRDNQKKFKLLYLLVFLKKKYIYMKSHKVIQ